MKLTATGRRHPNARGSEVIVLGYAPKSGAAWRPATDFAYGRRWHLNDQVLISDFSVPGIIGRSGASLRLKGKQPLLLILMHPWSGVVRLHLGLRIVEIDLFNPNTIGLMLDPAAGLAVEFDPVEILSGDKIIGTSRCAMDVLPDTLRLGRMFFPMTSNVSGVPWPRRQREGRTVMQRRPFFEIRQGISWVLARLGSMSTKAVKERILLAVLDGLAKKKAGGSVELPLSPTGSPDQNAADSLSEIEHRLVVLAGVIEGLTLRLDQATKYSIIER